MPPVKENFAFDLANWRGKSPSEIILDSSSGTIEASAAPLIERVNPVLVKLNLFAKWSDEKSQDPVVVASTRIYQWALENKTRGIEIWLPSKEPTENEILEALKSFPDFNPGDLIVWFSPRDSLVFKEGTRIGIYQVIYVNGEKYLFLRTLCNFDYGPKCTRSAVGLLPFSPIKENSITFSNTETLRATPLPLKVPGNSLSEFFKHHLHFPPDFWEDLSLGKDIEIKIKINNTMAQIITPAILEEINQAASFADQLRIGMYLEREFQEQTGRILKGGVCGILYSSVNLGFLSSILGTSIPNYEGGRRKHCGKCGKQGYFTEGETCPYDSSSRN